ncbi:S26 family signal peptidase [Chelativorans alearense]|uniref:S26 family signal peptidase n=1 Tax=Chelativorans alearense TaxID=2681495 RepID=UPI0013D27126|nr:S26 family signal peptidase [Chelativorans alearense]
MNVILHSRRRRAHKSPRIIFIFCILGVGLVGFAAFANTVPRLVWNASASAPIGLYRVVFGVPRRNGLVLVRAPEDVEQLADRRGYLPAGLPLIKRVAASAGDFVCVINGTVILNGEPAARQREIDRMGRALPHWSDCRELAEDELFLLTEAADSFDSRYFGPVASAEVIGRLASLWTE